MVVMVKNYCSMPVDRIHTQTVLVMHTVAVLFLVFHPSLAFLLEFGGFSREWIGRQALMFCVWSMTQQGGETATVWWHNNVRTCRFLFLSQNLKKFIFVLLLADLVRPMSGTTGTANTTGSSFYFFWAMSHTYHTCVLMSRSRKQESNFNLH